MADEKPAPSTPPKVPLREGYNRAPQPRRPAPPSPPFEPIKKGYDAVPPPPPAPVYDKLKPPPPPEKTR